MDRTNASGSVSGRYIDRNLSIGQPGTLLVGRDRNLVQEEIVNLLTGFGVSLDPNNEQQLYDLFNQLLGDIATDISDLDTRITDTGAGNLGFVTGTLADVGANTTRTDTISLPSTGNWLLTIEARLESQDGSGVAIREDGALGIGILLLNKSDVGQVLIRLSGSLYKSATNAITVYLQAGINSTIVNIRYYAIRIA